MSLKIILEESRVWPDLGVTFRFGLVRLANSFVLLVTDQEMFDLGTVVLAAPPQSFQVKPVASSYPLFGLKQNQLAGLLSKRASVILKAPVLTILFVKEARRPVELAKFLARELGELLSSVEGSGGEEGGHR
ncbi:MAG: hypothetical protein ACTSU5_19865 [Promethearchaeota archaeon]